MPTADEILTEPARALSETSSTVLIAGIALSSFSALLLELALTRLFSVVLFYHFAFLAISVALLGLGAGGVFAHLRKQKLKENSEVDIAYSVNGLGRFRANIFQQRGSVKIGRAHV